ncbi:MAG: queuosine precursor transporter [Crocinitomicaceae bacterium]
MFAKENIEEIVLARRREWVFLVLSGIFLGSLTMLNILGVSRFIDLSEYVGISPDSDIRFSVAIGVLPYPITFLCTDIISEIYGRKRANMIVWVGLILNVWVLLVLWFGGWLQQPESILSDGRLPIEVIDGEAVVPHGYSFFDIRTLTFGATLASMIAYIIAQFVDVRIFHYLKQRTNGKYLWLRNNVSTITSQLIDSIAVILITHYYAHGLPIDDGVSISEALLMFIVSSYLFKLFFALVDTIPIYIAVKYIRKYLKVEDELGF